MRDGVHVYGGPIVVGTQLMAAISWMSLARLSSSRSRVLINAILR